MNLQWTFPTCTRPDAQGSKSFSPSSGLQENADFVVILRADVDGPNCSHPAVKQESGKRSVVKK